MSPSGPTHPPITVWQRSLAILLVLFSFAMSAILSRAVFERMPHLEDELAYLYQARIFARGDVVIDSPTPTRAYWQPFVVDYRETGHRFGKYTPGWPALLALGELAGQLWIVNALLSALTVAFLFRLGSEIFDADTGLIAAALVAFSPMALLLNATLMGHTAALTCFTLFMLAYFRIERGRPTLRWTVIAGIALGLLIINRPLSAIGTTLPFILWSGLKILRAGVINLRPAANHTAEQLVPTLRPLVILGVIALLFAAILPLFNHATTGDPSKNLYTLIWSYDRVGFGECCGRNGHTIIKGIQHARFDISLTAADLFGWQVESVTPELQEHLRTSSSYWPALGLSLFILPFGVWIGFREGWLRAWLLIGLPWLVIPLLQDAAFLKSDEIRIWSWLGVGLLWMLVPPLAWTWHGLPSARSRWTWLLLAVAVSLIGLHLAYWVGSQRYSTRYYFEALSALAIIAALPIAWIARRTSRPVVYTLLTGVLLWSLMTYSLPRIEALYRFNQVSPQMIEQVQARRTTDAPALVLVTGQGSVSWRAFGSLMAVTGPYLDDEIVVAWDYNPGGNVRQQILERFPDREVIEMFARGTDSWFADESPVH